MKGIRQIKINESGRRCGHAYCSDCPTKRGRNLGNRRGRHASKTALKEMAR